MPTGSNEITVLEESESTVHIVIQSNKAKDDMERNKKKSKNKNKQVHAIPFRCNTEPILYHVKLILIIELL